MADTVEEALAAIVALDLGPLEVRFTAIGVCNVLLAYTGSRADTEAAIVRVLEKEGVVVVEGPVRGDMRLTIDYPYMPLSAMAYEKRTAPWGKKQRFGPGGDAFTRARKNGK